MSDDGVNTTRRRFLTAATSVVGAAGAVGAVVPFVGSWLPSAKAKAAGAPVKFDVSKLLPGEMKVVEVLSGPFTVSHVKLKGVVHRKSSTKLKQVFKIKVLCLNNKLINNLMVE